MARREIEAEDEMWAEAVAGHVPAQLGRRPRCQDYEFTCIECGRREIWSAERQEASPGGPAAARRFRCRACRGGSWSRRPEG